jgi:hypothetical protein
MVPYHRPKSGHITCYLNRTHHVLLTALGYDLDHHSSGRYHVPRADGITLPDYDEREILQWYEGTDRPKSLECVPNSSTVNFVATIIYTRDLLRGRFLCDIF